MTKREGASAAEQATDTRPAGTLELREERASVQIERVRAGQVRVSRQVQTRTETIAVELRRETLTVQVLPGEPAVMVNGQLLEPGESLELVFYDERAEVVKHLVVTEQVQVEVRTVTDHQQVPVELRRETLHVEQSGELHVSQTPASQTPASQMPAQQPVGEAGTGQGGAPPLSER